MRYIFDLIVSRNMCKQHTVNPKIKVVPLLKRVARIVWNCVINGTYVRKSRHVTVKMCLYRLSEVKSRREAEVREVNNKVLVELRRKRPSSHHPELCVKINKFAAFSSSKAAVDKYL